MIYAAVYTPEGTPRKFVRGSIRQVNANIRRGGTWREMPEDVVLLGDALTPDDWPVHPEMVEPEE